MANMHLGHRLAPPRFIAFVAIFVVGLFFTIPAQGYGRGAMIAFDIAAGIFLISIMPLFARGTAEQMRAAAQRNDANRAFLLLLTVVTSIIIMVSVVTEKLEKATPFTIVLVLVSLVLAWTFSNMIYALHYAHLYYLPAEDNEDSAGIEFPNCDDPDYWDFVFQLHLGHDLPDQRCRHHEPSRPPRRHRPLPGRVRLQPGRAGLHDQFDRRRLILLFP